MRTPRPSLRTSVKTLIGYGWLREAPKNIWPRGWDIKSRSALRKCVFLPVPPEAQAFLASLPPPRPFIPPPVQSKRSDTPVARRKDPAKDARVFAAVTPEDVRRKLLQDAQRAAMGKRPVLAANANEAQPRAWYEDPIALGTLLILVPPIGLAAVWSSKRYSSDARWALTVMTGLTMFLITAVVCAVMITH